MNRTNYRILLFSFLLLSLYASAQGDQQSETQDPQSATLPFATRVSNFWLWWQENTKRIQASADEDGGQGVLEELGREVEKLGPDFGWSLGPPPEGKAGHSFTLSPAGDRGLLFLTSFWLEQAPKLPEWHFYSSQRANSQLAELEVEIAKDTVVKAKDIWLSLTPAAKGQWFNLGVWSPFFEQLSPQNARHLAFLFLKEALGENDFARWVAEVDLVGERPEEAFAVVAVQEQLSKAAQAQDWVESPYETTQFDYTIKESGSDFLRHDIMQLSTLYSELSFDYIKNSGKAKNPILGTGASLKFFRIPKEQLPEQGDDMENFRYTQGVLELHLAEAHIGQAIGGGLGQKWAYFDVILFDEAAGMKALQKVISRFEGAEIQVYSFY